MLCILCLQCRDPSKLTLNQFLIFHFSDKIVSEIVVHDHVHIVRGQGTYAELNQIDSLHDMLGKFAGISLFSCYFLGLVEPLICLAWCHR